MHECVCVCMHTCVHEHKPKVKGQLACAGFPPTTQALGNEVRLAALAASVFTTKPSCQA